MIEKLIFNLLAFTLFILMFLNFIRKNDTNYTYIIAMQAIGIFVNFLEFMYEIKLSVFIKIIIYMMAVIMPIIVLIIEFKKQINITELIDILKANFYIIIRKNKKAEKILLNAIKRHPESIEIHEKLGKLYENENKIEEAIIEYEFAMNNIYEKKIYIKIGKLYEKIGKEERARTIFEDIIREEPENYEANMGLANILYNMNEFKYAIQIYNNILKYYPEDYDIYYSLGMTYTMLNDFKKAKESYEKAAQINSLSYCSKYSLGQLSLIYEELDEAERYFQECTEYEEIDAKAYYYLARISIIRGEEEKAINYSNIAVEIDPELYYKIQKDNIFVTIKNKINKPIKDKEKAKNKITNKEIDVDKHLEKMTKIVGKLKNDDIQMIENVMKYKQKEEKIKETIETKEKENE